MEIIHHHYSQSRQELILSLNTAISKIDFWKRRFIEHTGSIYGLDNPIFEYGPGVQPVKGWTAHREYYSSISLAEILDEEFHERLPALHPCKYPHSMQIELT